MNTFPIPDDFRPHVPRLGKSYVKVQTCSFWITAKRERFTSEATAHFQSQRLPETTMSGITLLAAKRNGTL